jgi:ribosomal protein L11 methyltransferase
VKRLGTRFQWQRLASIRWADAWEERLRALIGLDRVAIFTKTNARFIRLTAWNLSSGEARRLQQLFGGASKTQGSIDWAPATSRPNRAPLRVGGRLSVVWDNTARAQETKRFPGRPVILIPASAAFGTGEHATTGMCLRMLAAARIGEASRVLDVGTGSGLLAIAAAKLGAKRCEGFDNDPIAVRIALKNAEANEVAGACFFRRADVVRWSPSARRYDVILANLFLDLLLHAIPKFAKATMPNGAVILSGVLNHQVSAVEDALRTQRFVVREVKSRGKWSALLACAPA